MRFAPSTVETIVGMLASRARCTVDGTPRRGAPFVVRADLVRFLVGGGLADLPILPGSSGRWTTEQFSEFPHYVLTHSDRNNGKNGADNKGATSVRIWVGNLAERIAQGQAEGLVPRLSAEKVGDYLANSVQVRVVGPDLCIYRKR